MIQAVAIFWDTVGTQFRLEFNKPPGVAYLLRQIHTAPTFDYVRTATIELEDILYDTTLISARSCQRPPFSLGAPSSPSSDRTRKCFPVVCVLHCCIAIWSVRFLVAA